MPADTTTEPVPDRLCFVLDGRGGAARCPEAPPEPQNDAAFSWLHLRRDAPDAAAELDACGVSTHVLDALRAEETRPRCLVEEDGSGALLNLRGVNLNPGADPEDMISVRLWIEPHRVISVWLRPLKAVRDLSDALDQGRAPSSPIGLVTQLAFRLTDRIEPVVGAMEDRIDDFEDDAHLLANAEGDGSLTRLRRRAIILRRYMLPQRDALATLEQEGLGWITAREHTRLREAADRVTRLCEELDSLRERAQVLQDSVNHRRSDAMNRQMLVLSVVAAVFLPLGLLTGLLGINVGGIPLADDPAGFWIVTGLIVAVGAAVYAYLRGPGRFR